MRNEKQNRQWHFAINSGIRIELEEYAGDLWFEEEHKLGTGSKSIDLLIRKREGVVIHKNIGRIFRGHNIFEVKGMTDYVSIDTFYRSCGYGLFYKASSEWENRIGIEDITFSFITRVLPLKLIKHMEEFWGLRCMKDEEGIYYLEGAKIPVQFIITSRLNPEDNLWLQTLLNPIESQEIANRLLLEYKQHEGNRNYEEVMQQIIKQNAGIFKEDKIMCDALMEILEEKAEKMAVKLAEEKAVKLAEEKAVKLAEEKAAKLAEEMLEEKVKEYQNQFEKEYRRKLEEEYKIKLEEAVRERLKEMGVNPT